MTYNSPDGLIVTNHHCAFGAVARNSTPERNLVEDGFVARSRADELPGRGMIVRVLEGFEDVTDRIAPELPEDELKRIREIERRESAIVAECETQAGHRCYVARFDDGLPYAPIAGDAGPPQRRFVLFDSFEIHDVRVVAAPPRSVGEYGGEVDNWHWPRHTNDFSFIRAYVGPGGSQAEYADENVPYRPARWLEVSPGGVAKGDLVFVMGYPWSTERYMTAAEIEEQQEWYYPLRLEMFGEWISELEAAAERSAEAAILVSATLKGIHNARSHARGMIDALHRSGLLGMRRAEEAEFRT
ncbi:MAG: S46 family peptidase [Myxococcota bacterium]|nr:S46 family peptidase [Myxococcota bacterium]